MYGILRFIQVSTGTPHHLRLTTQLLAVLSQLVPNRRFLWQLPKILPGSASKVAVIKGTGHRSSKPSHGGILLVGIKKTQLLGWVSPLRLMDNICSQPSWSGDLIWGYVGGLAMPMMHEFAHSQDEAEIYKHAAAKLSISLILVLHNHHLFFEAAALRNPSLSSRQAKSWQGLWALLQAFKRPSQKRNQSIVVEPCRGIYREFVYRKY